MSWSGSEGDPTQEKPLGGFRTGCRRVVQTGSLTVPGVWPSSRHGPVWAIGRGPPRRSTCTLRTGTTSPLVPTGQGSWSGSRVPGVCRVVGVTGPTHLPPEVCLGRWTAGGVSGTGRPTEWTCRAPRDWNLQGVCGAWTGRSGGERTNQEGTDQWSTAGSGPKRLGSCGLHQDGPGAVHVDGTGYHLSTGTVADSTRRQDPHLPRTRPVGHWWTMVVPNHA